MISAASLLGGVGVGDHAVIGVDDHVADGEADLIDDIDTDIAVGIELGIGPAEPCADRQPPACR